MREGRGNSNSEKRGADDERGERKKKERGMMEFNKKNQKKKKMSARHGTSIHRGEEQVRVGTHSLHAHGQRRAPTNRQRDIFRLPFPEHIHSAYSLDKVDTRYKRYKQAG